MKGLVNLLKVIWAIIGPSFLLAFQARIDEWLRRRREDEKTADKVDEVVAAAKEYAEVYRDPLATPEEKEKAFEKLHSKANSRG